MTSTVLVTGGASGVGRAVSERFLRADWDVLVHYHGSAGRAESLAGHDGVTLYRADLARGEERAGLADAVAEQHPRLDLLVNNAAVFRRTPLETATEEDWDDHMELNARAPFFMVQSLTDPLRAAEGAVVNLLDWATRSPYPAYLPYFASKGALETLTRGLARALGPTVRVNGVSPGPIDFPEGYPEQQRQAIIDDTILGRQGRREEVAEAVFFLGVKATFTTGTVVEVDGGRHLR